MAVFKNQIKLLWMRVYNTWRGLGKIIKATIHCIVSNHTTVYDDYHFCCVRDDKTGIPYMVATRPLTKLGAHTYQDNTGNVGFAFSAMAGARQYPFDPGPFEITEDMLQCGAKFMAELCLICKLDPLASVLDHYLRSKLHPRYPDGYGKWDIVPYWPKFQKAMKFEYKEMITNSLNGKI